MIAKEKSALTRQ
jgi:hypothetical protein